MATPGPWEVRTKGVQTDGSDAGTFIGQVGSGLVAHTFTNKSNMQPKECLEAAQADARLIAAAPDLLLALKVAREELAEHVGLPVEECVGGVFVRINAAIAKADPKDGK